MLGIDASVMRISKFKEFLSNQHFFISSLNIEENVFDWFFSKGISNEKCEIKGRFVGNLIGRIDY